MSGPLSTTSPIIVNRELKREQALDFRAEGLTFQEIADKLEVSKTTAYELVREALDEIRKENDIRAVHLRDLELRRLDKQRSALWEKRANPDVANALTRISARVAALMGLDAPKKIEQSGPNGGPIKLDDGKVVLTDDERKNRLKALGMTSVLPSLFATNGNGNGHRTN